MCRASFEELVLDEVGGLRWNRLENLMEESSKSVDYDPAQLWLLAGSRHAARVHLLHSHTVDGYLHVYITRHVS